MVPDVSIPRMPAPSARYKWLAICSFVASVYVPCLVVFLRVGLPVPIAPVILVIVVEFLSPPAIIMAVILGHLALRHAPRRAAFRLLAISALVLGYLELAYLLYLLYVLFVAAPNPSEMHNGVFLGDVRAPVVRVLPGGCSTASSRVGRGHPAERPCYSPWSCARPAPGSRAPR